MSERPGIDDVARRAGLRPGSELSLASIERRRGHLLAVMFVVMAGLAVTVAVLTAAGGDHSGGLVEVPAVQVAAPLLTAALALYVLEKESQLHQLSRLLLEDHAVIAELAREARHDPLTGLPNRVAFLEILDAAIANHRSGDVTAVLFIDLDGFKTVNDTSGHAAGDELLAEVARRFERCLRPGDTLARMGGDEFTVILENLPGEGAAYEVADRLTSSLAGSRVTTSVGIAFATRDGASGDVLREADVAMYLAKQAGRDCWRVFGTPSPSPAEVA